MEKQTLKILGMSCEHCVKAVSNALKELPSLDGVHVDLKSGSASFSYDPVTISLEKIKAAIIDAGYNT